MNPYLTAKKTQTAPPVAMLRIDVVLALYDGAIERIESAQKLLRARNRFAALPLIGKSQLIVSELAAGVKLEVDEDMGTNYLLLYEFIVNRLKDATLPSLEDALKILKTLREGFAGIREEAISMERRGEFVASDRMKTLCETA
jgi:flagellar secretion chaperone FliS